MLCYHRIGHVDDQEFTEFRPNISATPEQFALQMKLVKTLFSPVSLQDVLDWRETERPLPRRPALVTFDDGYKDNGDVAWPIMRDLGIPGVVFLATNYIGTGKPFLWDFAALCLERTPMENASIPLLGKRLLSTPALRQASTSDWVAATKKLPAAERWHWAETLASALRVPPPCEVISGLCLDWAAIRRLDREGLEFGGHTRSHPILSRLPALEAQEEIAGCQADLTAELGRPARAFAYPNGSGDDFSCIHEDAARQAGFSIGFSLEPGPARLREIQQRPMAVRRLYVGMRDSIPRLLAKCFGAARLLHDWRTDRRFHSSGGAEWTGDRG